MKEDWVLGDDAQLSSQAVQSHIPDVLIADQDTPHRWIIKSVEQSYYCRLTGKKEKHTSNTVCAIMTKLLRIARE